MKEMKTTIIVSDLVHDGVMIGSEFADAIEVHRPKEWNKETFVEVYKTKADRTPTHTLRSNDEFDKWMKDLIEEKARRTAEHEKRKKGGYWKNKF